MELPDPYNLSIIRYPDPRLRQLCQEVTEFDARLAWKPAENIELSVTGRNLGGAHQEFSKYVIEESVFFKVKIEFGK